MSMEIDKSMAGLGAEKSQEVSEIVKRWMDEVEITTPDALTGRVIIKRVVFHAIVDDVPVVFQSDVDLE